jgi:hypothetical protein
LAQSINRAIHSVANLIADWMSERAAA